MNWVPDPEVLDRAWRRRRPRMPWLARARVAAFFYRGPCRRCGCPAGIHDYIRHCAKCGPDRCEAYRRWWGRRQPPPCTRCGCARRWHEHYRAGEECSRCGAETCPGYRRFGVRLP